MNKSVVWFLVMIMLFSVMLCSVSAQDETLSDEEFNEQEEVTVSDPLEPFNRLMFKFNDRLYFWVLKPVARGYSFVFPQDARVAIRNFFHNLFTPIRVVNDLLQGKLKRAGKELARFCINTTAGVFGFADVAAKEFNLKVPDEDFGQTLGVYGIGHGIYVVWPVVGPSSLRDTVGLIGDLLLDPLSYLNAEESLMMRGVYTINNTSLRIGEYEDLKKSALDPYISLQDAYLQYRLEQTRE